MPILTLLAAISRWRRWKCPALPHFCSNTDLDGWPRSMAGVLRAAGETQGQVYCLLAGWLCCGRAAQGWHPQGPGSYRRGHYLGHRGHSAGPRAQGHIHSLVGSGPRPHAQLQSGPRCTAEHRPLSGRRESRSWAQLLVAKAWCISPWLTTLRRGEACWDWYTQSSWQHSSPQPTACPTLSPDNRDGRQGHYYDCSTLS